MTADGALSEDAVEKLRDAREDLELAASDATVPVAAALLDLLDEHDRTARAEVAQ